MNWKTFFQKSIGRIGFCTLYIVLAIGLVQPAKTAAFSLGSLGGAIVGAAQQQDQVRKSLDYYENDGRNELFEQIKSSDGVVDDPDLNDELNQIMTRLTAAIATTEPTIANKPYNYFINSQQEFNAYCTLGHNLSVNIGAFSFLKNNEDEVGAVVAHELVHGQRNHPIEGAKKKMTVDFIQKVAGSQMDGGGRLAVDVVAVNAKNVGVTKPNEWEADNVAFGYLTTAGYNPGAPAAVWQRVIDKMSSGGGNFLNDILNPSTHPGDKERRDNYSKKLTAYSNNKVTVDSSTGEIKINNKTFMKPAAYADMSGLERGYLIAGRLASVYHGNASVPQATNDDGVVHMGDVAIVQPCPNDADADQLATTLNAIR